MKAKIESISNLPEHGKIYFVGIGGISMSGLAELSKHMGFSVAGSDAHLSERTQILQRRGIPVFGQKNAEPIIDFAPDLLVYTAAVLPGNPELAYAEKNDIPTMGRAEYLGLITAGFTEVINISGTHGKTTTTAMTSLILLHSGMDPTVHLGAELNEFDGSIRTGKGRELLVSEACEYQRSFLQFFSTTAVITNIDYDHVDCYTSLSEVIEVFAEFTAKISDSGTLVVPAFDPNVMECLCRMPKYREAAGLRPPKIISIGKKGDIFPLTGKEPDILADHITYENGFPSFDVYADGEYFTHIDMAIPGEHNIYNALFAITSARCHGGTAKAAQKVLSSFKGADGRYTVKGYYKGAVVVADYAHHPAAAKATLQAAAQMPHKKIWVVFQPLTYKRTEILFDDYIKVLLPCQHVLFAEIFSDREINTGTISSADLTREINKRGGTAEFIPDKDEIKKRLSELVGDGDLILFLGPEDIRDLANELV